MTAGHERIVVGQTMPFGPGSVMLAVYPHPLRASELLDDLLEQARLAESVGFDGVTLAEHHGLAGYMPNPLQVSGWVLDETETIWAGACPLLLPLRTATLAAEEVAWLAVRYPGRVAAGFGPGYAEIDYEIAGQPRDDRVKRFAAALPEMVKILQGRAEGVLSNDAAVAATLEHPIPVVSTVAGPVGARRAGRAGAGLILGPFNSIEKSKMLIDAFREVGGTGPAILIRRPWVGGDARSKMRDLAAYYQGIGADESWMSEDMSSQLVFSSDGKEIAERLADTLRETGATSLRVMFNLPDTTASDIREQIERFGTEVIPTLRSLFKVPE